MMITRKLFLAVLLISTAFTFSGCKKDKNNGNFTVRMTDAPGPYQQVNVQILQVNVHLENTSNNDGWHSLPTNSGVYDLLALQNGIDTTIVNTSMIPSGDVTQMRLLLGSQNTVMVDSIIHPLKVPSGSQSGIKLNGNIEVVSNATTSVLIDFDANQSVVLQGNGDYHLKPVIKVVE